MASAPYGRSSADLPPSEEFGAPVDEKVNISYEGSITRDDGTFDEEALVRRASAIFTQSTDYMDANISAEWERALAHFNSKHSADSKYLRNDYRRSKIFRPKTRANVKNQEAGLATAMFSTTGLVNVEPQNPSDQNQIGAAALIKELMQYRLEQRMPWALTVQGAYQDTKVYGICVSHQYWSLRQKEFETPVTDHLGQPVLDEAGNPAREKEVDIEEDELRCDLVPPENFRFDPMADWRDVATTSSFIVLVRPMRVVDVEAMMKSNGGQWMDRPREAVVSAGMNSGDRVRSAREGYERTDASDSMAVDGLTTVWAHMNIVREGTEDWVFWTLGTELLMTEPRRLMDMEPWLRKGERPFVIGMSSVETHRTYPAGDVLQMATLQQEINEVANQRIDNVRLVLNKRYFIRRGAQVNIESLMRNVPGGAVQMSDTEKDVKEVATPDVTGSAYREHEALAMEMDELAGGFDAQKMASDGGTPGGIARAGAVASAVRDYGVWLFVSTWVQPVLRQLMRLEQTYEADETIVALAANRANLPRFDGSETDDLLSQELYLRVDAGIGTLDPIRKVDRLRLGIETVMNLPDMAMRLKSMRVANEVFSALGFVGAERFFDSEQEFQEKMANMPQQPSDIEVKMQELEIRNQDNQMRHEREMIKLEAENARLEREAAMKAQSQLDDRMADLQKVAATLQTQRDIAAVKTQAQRDSAAISAMGKADAEERRERSAAEDRRSAERQAEKQAKQQQQSKEKK